MNMTPEEQAFASANADEITRKVGPQIMRLIEEAVAIGEGPVTLPQAAKTLYHVTTAISDLVTPFTPCRDKCSHCCKQAVALSSFEAAMIAQYTERPLIGAGLDVRTFAETQQHLPAVYRGVDCTFLKEGICSIYPVRPIACRTHHSLNETSDNCVITDEEKGENIPKLNYGPLFMIHMAVFQEGGCTFADIREWFPPDL